MKMKQQRQQMAQLQTLKDEPVPQKKKPKFRSGGAVPHSSGKKRKNGR